MITPTQNSILTTTSKVISSASAFFVGFLINTTNTRWGKVKPWLFVTAILGAACNFFQWFSPGVESSTGKLIWYLVFYGGFNVLLTGYGNARDTLVMYASNEPRERDTLNAYMSAFQIVGVILSALIQQGTFALFHADLGYNPCSNGTHNSTNHGPSRDTETKQINTALMLQYTFGMSGQVFYVLFVYMAAAVVAIFLWNLALRRIGRKKVICLGILLCLLPHNAALLIATEDLLGTALRPFIYASSVLGGAGEGCMYISLRSRDGPLSQKQATNLNLGGRADTAKSYGDRTKAPIPLDGDPRCDFAAT
ncbi:MFSD2A [Branchiostoma lanceolatum]|uniref:MFSD2A protein n=1 Tax=Branchiostoma lanceolatum TaxID=7740 RepID=A0A8S4MME7_BRALA|nr:MFSD2A [Branchiostoma lanceolatum]